MPHPRQGRSVIGHCMEDIPARSEESGSNAGIIHSNDGEEDSNDKSDEFEDVDMRIFVRGRVNAS